MAFDSSSSDSGMISQINITPFVDVVLVLLIIFMVTAPILQQGVELDLPKESIAPIEGKEEQVVVSINKTGKVFIGAGNEVAVADLGKRLSGILQKTADKRVFIRADKSVEYGHVMAVMGSIRRAGISRVGLITEPT